LVFDVLSPFPSVYRTTNPTSRRPGSLDEALSLLLSRLPSSAPISTQRRCDAKPLLADAHRGIMLLFCARRTEDRAFTQTPM